MDDYYRNKEADETENMNSGDIVSQLKDKIKFLTQRVCGLENYKLLCEERISELCPSHPFPITPDHIGSGSSSISQELLNSKQKLAKLEQQLAQTSESIPNTSGSPAYNKLHELYTSLHLKFNAALKEKSDLEESLRNEVLSNEEQRAYIEVLKQAIEIRTESLGLKGMRAEAFAEYSQARMSIDESRRETSKIATKLIDYEAQIKSLTENLNIRENDFNEVSNEKDELTEQLHQAAEALQYAEEEVQKLEEEKANLIEYIDSQSKIEQNLIHEINQFKLKSSSLQEDVNKYSKSLNDTTEENQKLKSELDIVKVECNRNEKNLKESQQAFFNLKARVEEKDKALAKYKDENNSMAIKNSSLQAENITFAGTLEKTEAELREYKEDLGRSKAELETERENFSKVKNFSQQLQEEKLKVEKNYMETDHRLQNLQGDFNILTEKNNQLTKSLQNSNSEIESLKAQIKALQDKYEALSHQSNELKKQTVIQKNELESLLKLQQSTNSELQSSIKENESLQMKLASSNQENSSLEQKLRELNILLEGERQNLRLSKEENYKLKYRLEDLNSSFHLASQDVKDKEDQRRTAEDELDSLTNLMKQVQSELAQEKYQKRLQFEELCSLNNELDKTKREMNSFKELYEKANRAARNITSQLSPLNTQRFRESSSQFTEKSNLDSSLHLWIEGLLQEMQEITQRFTEAMQLCESLKHKNALLASDLENFNQDICGYRSKEIVFKNQVENISKENAYLRDTMKTQTNCLQQEIVNLRNDMQEMYEENETISSKNRNVSAELLSFKSKVAALEQNIVAADKKYKSLLSEKEHVENLLASYRNSEKPFNNSYRITN